jgi:hypothetical protein
MSAPKETAMLNAMVKTAIEAASKLNRLFHPSAIVDATGEVRIPKGRIGAGSAKPRNVKFLCNNT